MSSPAFSSFRQLMDIWDKNSKIFLENDLCMFFKKDGSIYGATESGRITFARLKNPESQEDDAWSKEANFTAYDLEKGNNSMAVFGLDDIKKLEIISQEEAEKQLKKKGKSMPVVKDDDEQGNNYGEK